MQYVNESNFIQRFDIISIGFKIRVIPKIKSRKSFFSFLFNINKRKYEPNKLNKILKNLPYRIIDGDSEINKNLKSENDKKLPIDRLNR